MSLIQSLLAFILKVRPNPETIYYGIVFVLLVIIGFVAIGINPLKRSLKIKSITKSFLKSQRDRITGRSLSPFEKFVAQLEGILKRLNKSMNYFYFLMVLAFIGGITLGSAFFSDLYLSIVTGICFIPIPYLYLLIRISWYTRQEEESLQNAMDIITNAYLGTEDIPLAFQSYSQSEMRYSDKASVFSQFLAEVLYVDPNIERALLILSEKVNNPYFSQWVKMLMLCHNDRRLKFSLRPIVDSMTDAKYSHMEHETIMAQVWRDYFTLLILMFLIIPIFRIMNYNWYSILTQTPIGKFLLTLMLMTGTGSAFLIMFINRAPSAQLIKKMQKRRIRT